MLLDVTGSGASQQLTVTTNCADRFACDAEHPLRVAVDPRTGEPSPYVLVRDRLEALIARPVFYQLVELAEMRGDVLTIRSCGSDFPLGRIGTD